MSKPQVGTTFPFMELPGKQCCIWNDFRYPHAPISWGDLLNLLDNEAFLVGMPKGEGRKDHHWNATNGEKVFMVMTSNNPIVYCSDGALNQTETAAFNERFGSIYHFPMRWPKKSKTCVTSNGGAASDATVTGSYRLHEVDDVRATTVMVMARFYLVKTTSRSRRTSPHTPLQAVLS